MRLLGSIQRGSASTQKRHCEELEGGKSAALSAKPMWRVLAKRRRARAAVVLTRCAKWRRYFRVRSPAEVGHRFLVTTSQTLVSTRFDYSISFAGGGRSVGVGAVVRAFAGAELDRAGLPGSVVSRLLFCLFLRQRFCRRGFCTRTKASIRIADLPKCVLCLLSRGRCRQCESYFLTF